MKKYKTLISFTGIVSSNIGEIIELDDRSAKDLLRAGYVEAVNEEKKEVKGVGAKKTPAPKKK